MSWTRLFSLILKVQYLVLGGLVSHLGFFIVFISRLIQNQEITIKIHFFDTFPIRIRQKKQGFSKNGLYTIDYKKNVFRSIDVLGRHTMIRHTPVVKWASCPGLFELEKIKICTLERHVFNIFYTSNTSYGIFLKPDTKCSNIRPLICI